MNNDEYIESLGSFGWQEAIFLVAALVFVILVSRLISRLIDKLK